VEGVRDLYPVFERFLAANFEYAIERSVTVGMAEVLLIKPELVLSFLASRLKNYFELRKWAIPEVKVRL
jgi:hypothetical protein